jgi:hypothetical protein
VRGLGRTAVGFKGEAPLSSIAIFKAKRTISAVNVVPKYFVGYI